jgi:single-stranded-DNA-specific exonuclease
MLSGGKHLKLVVSPRHSNSVFDAIAFNVSAGVWPRHDVSELQLVYRLDINEYRGTRNLQLMIEHLAPYDG